MRTLEHNHQSDMESSREYNLIGIIQKKDYEMGQLIQTVAEMIEANPHNSMLGVVNDRLWEIIRIGRSGK